MLNKLLQNAKELNYPPLALNEIHKVEETLSVKFAEDFYKLAQVCDYEYLLKSGYEFFNFSTEGEYSVIGETLKMRSVLGLPKDYILLALVDDASAVLLKTENCEKQNQVMLCTIPDLYNLCRSEPLGERPKIFTKFSDFFEYLLSSEES